MKRAQGFTLLEVTIAMVILSAGLVLLASSWSGSFSMVRKTQKSFEIAALLERKMTEIEIKYRGKPLTEIKDEDSGDFGDDAPDYSWSLTSKQLELPDLSSAINSGAKDGAADQLTLSLLKQLSEGLSKAIKEVTVTIIYKQPKKNLEYSITTYFVNYDQEMTFGVPGG